MFNLQIGRSDSKGFIDSVESEINANIGGTSRFKSINKNLNRK